MPSLQALLLQTGTGHFLIIHSRPKTGNVSQHSFKVRKIIHFGLTVKICKTKLKHEYGGYHQRVQCVTTCSIQNEKCKCLESINLCSTANNHHHQCTTSQTAFCVSWKLWLDVVRVRVQNRRKLLPCSAQRGRGGDFFTARTHLHYFHS